MVGTVRLGSSFADDGYVLKPGKEKFTPTYLEMTKILVIANAVGDTGEWKLPTLTSLHGAGGCGRRGLGRKWRKSIPYRRPYAMRWRGCKSRSSIWFQFYQRLCL